MILPIYLYAVPVIKSVSPYFGPESGATLVTITGNGFIGTTTIGFGNSIVTPLSVSNSEIQVYTPPHVPQSVSVIVNTPESSSDSSPDSYFVYQGNLKLAGAHDSDYLYLFDLSSVPSIQSTLNVSLGLIGLSFTPDGSQLYCLPGGNDHEVVVVDVASSSILTRISLGGQDTSAGVVFQPNGSTAYISNENNNQIHVVNTSDFSSQIVPVGTHPFQLAITPSGDKVFVSNNGDPSVSVIDTATLSVTTITLPPGSIQGVHSLAVSPDGSSVYAVGVDSNPSSAYLYQIDVSTFAATLIQQLPQNGDYTSGSLALSSNGEYVFISNLDTSEVTAFTTSPTPAFYRNIALTPTPSSPSALIVAPDNLGLYVPHSHANGGNGVISYVDLSESQETSVVTIRNLADLNSICTAPDGLTLYLGSGSGGTGTGIIELYNSDPASVYSILPTVPTKAMDLNNIAPDQAPLAKYTVKRVQNSEAGIYLFDGSQSLSPIGEIVNYEWNFGDGTAPQTTTSPQIVHQFTQPGRYSVSLRVTNGAGTSTQKKYNNASFKNNYNLYNPGLLNNGGPTALLQKNIVVALPIVEAVDPHTGCEKGGKKVSIIGSNFIGATAVYFGRHLSTSFEVVSDSMIIASVPKGKGKVKVKVHSGFGVSASSVVYTYQSCGYCPQPYKLRKRCKNRSK